MRHLAAAAALMAMIPALAVAQAPPATPYRPYTFAAPGAVSTGPTTLHLGGGFDVLAPNGLGASVEGGYVGPIPDGFDNGFGVVSMNAVYHAARPRRHRLTPFVTGGYSLGFRSRRGSAINFGGGANYWLSDTVGLRFEFRDHMPIADRLSAVHIWGARIGVTWVR